MNANQQTEVKESISDYLSTHYTMVEFSATTGPRTRTDRGQSKELNRTKGAKRGASRVVKDLWAGASAEVDAIDAAIVNARRIHNSLTAAVQLDGHGNEKGDRLLRNVDLLADGGYAAQVADAKKEINRQLGIFEQVYDLRVRQAMANLGELADANDYPTFAQYQAAVGITFRPYPVTTESGWGMSTLMLEEAGERLVQSTTNNVERQVTTAIRQTVARVIKPLEAMIKGTTPKEDGKYPRMFDTMVTNLKDLVPALRSFNLYGDPEITKLVDAVESRLTKYTPEQLRANEGLKRELNGAAKSVQDMLSAMEAFQ